LSIAPRLDEIDKKILEILQEDCKVSLEEVAKKLKISKSAARYRIKKLENDKIILGYYAKLNPAKLGNDHVSITLIDAKYGPGYHEKVGKRIASIHGVCGVYYVLGQYDFVAFTRSSSAAEFMQKLKQMMNMREVERTRTQVVAEVIKDDHRIDLTNIPFTNSHMNQSKKGE